MVYPPQAHLETRPEIIERLLRSKPFAHFFTSSPSGPLVTRLPFVADFEGARPVRLRAHMNRNNPQARKLDMQECLVAFSGADSFVSPNWRLDKSRGATWDYTSVHIWGEVRLQPERRFFETLVNDLARHAEGRFKRFSDDTPWQIEDAPAKYVDRMFSGLISFEVRVERIEAISKLHQDFPEADALSVSEHLLRSDLPDSVEIGSLIKEARNRPTEEN